MAVVGPAAARRCEYDRSGTRVGAFFAVPGGRAAAKSVEMDNEAGVWDMGSPSPPIVRDQKVTALVNSCICNRVSHHVNTNGNRTAL